MTVEVVNKAEETCVGEAMVVSDDLEKEVAEPKAVEKSSSYKEESNFLSDLKDFERKALSDLKAKLEDAILGNNLYEKKKKKEEKHEDEPNKVEEVKEEEQCAGEEAKPDEAKEEEKCGDGEAKTEEAKAEEAVKEEEEEEAEEVDREVSLWGVPLLPSKGAEGTDVILLKFLRAREFKVAEALEMLRKTLQWRRDSGIEGVAGEELCVELGPGAAYVGGVDREGHPVCYNVFGAFESEEAYQSTFGTEEKRERFVRWRCQLMEKSIAKLDFRPAGVSSLLQVNDLKNSPGPSKKELRIATKHAVGILQDNYPELVAKNIFINVPFWFYALNALLSPFLTQRTKSKFVVARPAKVAETLLKYIPAEEIPVQYGGFKRDDDFEFFGEESSVSEVLIKAGATEAIEITVPEADTTLVWDITVLGWEVSYKEEFVPCDEGSYTVIVQKGRKMAANEGLVRNTFRSNEPGKVVLTIVNASSKKKRVMYRYKTKKTCSF